MNHLPSDTAPGLPPLSDRGLRSRQPSGEERCDACPAPAVALVRLANGKELVLCGSHAHRHATRLLAQGAAIIGDYSRGASRHEGPITEDRAEPLTYTSWWRRLAKLFRDA